MRRFRFRPYKVKIRAWKYLGQPLDSDEECPAILCASEEDADLLLQLLEERVREMREQAARDGVKT